MTITRIDTDIKIPFDFVALSNRDPKEQARGILQIVKALQEILEQIITVSNLSVDLNDGALYSKLKQADGTYPLGTWRLIQVGDNWERQVQLTLNEWTFAGNFERPGT